MTVPYTGRLFRPGMRVQIGPHGFANRDGTGLRMAARVRRSLAAQADSADLRIWGLAPERRAALRGGQAQAPQVVRIEAGYDGALSQMFVGEVRRLSTDPEPDAHDTTTRVEADDGGRSLAQLSADYSTAGWTAENMIDVAVARISAGDPAQGIAPYPLARHGSTDLAIASASTEATRLVLTGAVAGRVTDLLDEAARLLRVRWWVRDGLLFMAARRRPTNRRAVVLERRHFVGTPREDADGRLVIPTMFHPDLVPGQQVALRDPFGTTHYRVAVSELNADTHGPTWAVTVALEEL